MDRFLEYINHHYYLAAGTVIVAIIAAVYELRGRARGATSISSNTAIMLHNKGALMLDVRNTEEFAGGHIIDARHIALDKLSESLDSIKKYREKPVVAYCEMGSRSAQAAKLLRDRGFTTVFSLEGGLAAWRKDNLPLTKAKAKA